MILKQTRVKFPIDVNIIGNIFLEYSSSIIDYSDVEGNTRISLSNNSVLLRNETFFRFFDSKGNLKANDLFENFIFKGDFANLFDSDEMVSSITISQRLNVIGEGAYLKDISFNIASDNVHMENLFLNITDAIENTFSFKNANGSRLINSIIHFYSGDDGLSPIYADNSSISLNNNTIIVYSDNHAIILNNSQLGMEDNIINDSSLRLSAILNDNASYILFGENEINSLLDPIILSLHGSKVRYTYFVVDDSNYHEYFNPDGTFLDDVIFNFGDTFRIGNANNKTFRFDIPLIIIAQAGSALNNCSIILEGESSGSVISNFNFRSSGFDLNGDISIISVKDGVSNLLISRNNFYIWDLAGDSGSLNAIGIDAYETYRNISILDNHIDINASLPKANGIIVKNEGFKIYDEIIEGMTIANNSISIRNLGDGADSIGIGLLSSADCLIFNNSIDIKSYSAKGILLENCSDFNILNNTIEVYGYAYEQFLSHIQDADFDIKGFVEDNQIVNSAILIDRSTDLKSIILDDNAILENNLSSNIIHFDIPYRDLENIIKNAEDGEEIDLGNNVYVISDFIDVNKAISLRNGILISYLKDKNVLFNIVSNSKKSFKLSNASVFLDNANVFALVNGQNITDHIIDVPSIDIKGNVFKAISDQVVGESVTLVKLVSGSRALSLDNLISIRDNEIASGMNAFEFEIDSVVNGSDVSVPSSPISMRNPSRIICQNMTTTAVDVATDGRAGKYFNILLTDEDGNPLSNKEIQIGFNGNVYKRVTDSKGQAKLQINLRFAGYYTFAVSFLGDDRYNGSFEVAKIIVNKQKPVISTSNYYYKSSAKSKKISISLKSASKRALKNKTIKLTLNGKTYSAKTNSKGVATISVSLSKKGSYSFTVKNAGDNTYVSISKKAKLVIS